MSVQLLDKTRKINKLLHNTSSSKVVFNDICKVMVDTLKSNILVISKKGKVLGVGKCDGVDELTELLSNNVGEFIDKLLNERFLGVLSTKENVNLITLGFEGDDISTVLEDNEADVLVVVIVRELFGLDPGEDCSSASPHGDIVQCHSGVVVEHYSVDVVTSRMRDADTFSAVWQVEADMTDIRGSFHPQSRVFAAYEYIPA